MKTKTLKDKYKSKLRTAAEAVRMIRSGQRVFIGSSCGEPQHLVNALMDNANFFSDVEIVRLLSVEGSLLALMADEYRGHTFNVRSIYQGSDQTKGLRANKRFITPMNLCAVPDLFKKRLFPIHFALIQVSPPDDHGWMSLGIRIWVIRSKKRRYGRRKEALSFHIFTMVRTKKSRWRTGLCPRRMYLFSTSSASCGIPAGLIIRRIRN